MRMGIIRATMAAWGQSNKKKGTEIGTRCCGRKKVLTGIVEVSPTTANTCSKVMRQLF